MKTFEVSGYSDDIVGYSIDGKAEDEKSPPCTFTFTAEGKALSATMAFTGKKGTGWKLSIELQDEKESGDLPFDVSIVQNAYSPSLLVTAKRGTTTVLCRSKVVASLSNGTSPTDATDK